MSAVGRALLGYLADGAYEETQARYNPDDLLAGLRVRYGGSMAEVYAEEVADLERRLDREWSGWRAKKPYAHLPGRLPTDARNQVKLWLTRRRQILIGQGALGLRLVKKLDGSYRAAAVRPAFAPLVAAREPDLAINPKAPKISIPVLAFKAGVTLERAEEAMRHYNPSIERNQLQHIKDWCAAHPEVRA